MIHLKSTPLNSRETFHMLYIPVSSDIISFIKFFDGCILYFQTNMDCEETFTLTIRTFANGFWNVYCCIYMLPTFVD